MKAPTFAQHWCAMLWRVMSATGKGYRLHSMRRTGRAEDRRADKLEAAELGLSQRDRRYRDRYR